MYMLITTWVPPRFKLGSLDSKSRVITATPRDLIWLTCTCFTLAFGLHLNMALYYPTCVHSCSALSNTLDMISVDVVIFTLYVPTRCCFSLAKLSDLKTG